MASNDKFAIPKEQCFKLLNIETHKWTIGRLSDSGALSLKWAIFIDSGLQGSRTNEEREEERL